MGSGDALPGSVLSENKEVTSSVQTSVGLGTSASPAPSSESPNREDFFDSLALHPWSTAPLVDGKLGRDEDTPIIANHMWNIR